MKIAILGATSEIAKDLILSFSTHDNYELVLFARRPQEVATWLSGVSLPNKYLTLAFKSFKDIANFDAILNFVGAGDPAKTAEMGNSILDVTKYYDEMAIDYLKLNPRCRYIFMSSGAAYGAEFSEPVDINTKASFGINSLGVKDWYGVSKFYAECRHRALADLKIVDVRIFNYCSSTQNINSKYLMADILRAIRHGKVLQTSEENIVRDYLGPNDFHQLIKKILLASPSNIAIDCYSKAPISKLALLDKLHLRFGLKFDVNPAFSSINETRVKLNYFSKNYLAATLGYSPSDSSIDVVNQAIIQTLENKIEND
jgi:nucleoside-diphosphate-sugar epimerase